MVVYVRSRGGWSVYRCGVALRGAGLLCMMFGEEEHICGVFTPALRSVLRFVLTLRIFHDVGEDIFPYTHSDTVTTMQNVRLHRTNLSAMRSRHTATTQHDRHHGDVEEVEKNNGVCDPIRVYKLVSAQVLTFTTLQHLPSHCYDLNEQTTRV